MTNDLAPQYQPAPPQNGIISLINAGPGTGKTFSLHHSYLFLKRKLMGEVELTDEQQNIIDYVCSEFSVNSSICFFAHSNSAKENLINRLGKKGPKVFTFHGAGQSCLIKRHGYQKLVNNRTEKHIAAMTGQTIYDMDWPEKKKWWAIKKICQYLKTESLPPEQASLDYLLLKYADLATHVIPHDWEDLTNELLIRTARPDGEVEFTDMIWLGKQTIRRPIYDLGFVDESQDIFRSSYELVTRMCKNVIFCGDKNQAINAFAGASEEMYDSIANKADAILPLLKTQRCPPHICDLANLVRPGGITQGPNQQEGINAQVDINSLPEMLVGKLNPTSCLFVSRTNASIIGLALFFHKHNIPARIIDKDLANEITNFIKSFKVKTIPALKDKLDKWLTRMSKARNPMWVGMCEDKYSYITKIINECKSYSEISTLITATFEKHKTGFPLTTIHKAKGLEALNIFIVNPPVELPYAMDHPIGREQEINLHFVALTRSALNLYWVN